MKVFLISFLFVLLTSTSMCQDNSETMWLIEKENYEQILNIPVGPPDQSAGTTDRWPMYIHGRHGLDRFIQDNLQYPEQSIEENIYGIVVFDYIITSGGSITDIRILESPHSILSMEVMRLMRLSGPWLPGIKDGQYYPMRMSKSIEFKSQCKIRNIDISEFDSISSVDYIYATLATNDTIKILWWEKSNDLINNIDFNKEFRVHILKKNPEYYRDAFDINWPKHTLDGLYFSGIKVEFYTICDN